MMACGFCLLQAIFSQQLALSEGADFVPPLDIELFLAGNYGELRPNHFHAGLDFKTQGQVGFPVHAFADGFVHRIGINAYGYGLVVYVRHPQLGVTSVYAHLDSFSELIYNKVRAKQVELEQNNIALTFSPEELPVTKGMVIAKSGNTGSSGGPHVHFELRDCNDEDDAFFDPLPLFVDKIHDTQAPRIHQLYIYPLGGTVMGTNVRQQSGIVKQPNGKQNLSKPFTAWGRIGLGLKAYDYMDGQANIYGIKSVKLFAGDSLIYHFEEDCFRYSENRYTNSLIDYEAWTKHRSTIMKSFIEPGNRLQMLDATLGDGTIVIDEERLYQFRYELCDAYGNKTEFSFQVKGVCVPAPASKPRKGYATTHDTELRVDTLGCSFLFPAGTFYDAEDLTIGLKTDSTRDVLGQRIMVVGEQTIPLHKYYDISLPVPLQVLDSIRNPQKLYIVNLDGGYVGGRYESGNMKASVREFGRFALRIDNTAPSVEIRKMTHGAACLVFADRESGVSKWKVWIDDQFVPFDMDSHGRCNASPGKYGVKKGRLHNIRIWTVDRCGNEKTIELTKTF